MTISGHPGKTRLHSAWAWPGTGVEAAAGHSRSAVDELQKVVALRPSPLASRSLRNHHNTLAKPAATTSKPPAPMPAPTKSRASEIDDIFASKPKAQLAAAGAAPTPNPGAGAGAAKAAAGAISSLPPTKSQKKKAKAKAAGVVGEVAGSGGAGGGAGEEVPGRKAPEVIADTSAAIDRYRVDAPPTLKRKAGEEGEKEQDEEDRFMDSRGTTREWGDPSAGSSQSASQTDRTADRHTRRVLACHRAEDGRRAGYLRCIRAQDWAGRR